MAIERDERVGSRAANLIELHRSEELCLTLAIECGPAVAGYRRTHVATVERTMEEFNDETFAASGGRIVIWLRFPRPGYYALSADVVCPVGRAGSMLKLSPAIRNSAGFFPVQRPTRRPQAWFSTCGF